MISFSDTGPLLDASISFFEKLHSKSHYLPVSNREFVQPHVLRILDAHTKKSSEEIPPSPDTNGYIMRAIPTRLFNCRNNFVGHNLSSLLYVAPGRIHREEIVLLSNYSRSVLVRTHYRVAYSLDIETGFV